MEEAGWRKPATQAAKQEIDQMRNAIDRLDQTIATLLEQRMMLSCEIGAVKAESQIAVKDNTREQQVLDNVRSTTDSPAVASALANIYMKVMEESCVLQDKLQDAGNGGTARCDATEPAGSTVYFPRVLVIGLGLIGASMARQIKSRLAGTVVTAIDRQDVLDAAAGQGIIDAAETDLSKAIGKAGLILLCANPAENLRLLEQIAPMTKRRQVIVDVTSTKSEICALAERLPMKADFVGGHPLFGSHKAGLAGSREVVVDGQRFCLVPTQRAGELTMRRLARWLTDLGLRVVHTTADEHDQAIARTSHTVQLMSVALGSALARGRSDEQLRQMLAVSGPGLQSMSRLMSSPAPLWLEIVKQNREPISRALGEVIDELQRTRDEVLSGNEESLKERFAQASRVPSGN